ncbi:uncharacterized protein [Ptychodera flava]|uniref:uncharacterized protein n=1 Tax=Ptychodera flava TaxID=63121 RepID=UPI00396A50AB
MTEILFAVFMIFIPILFRNMLIAKMAKSYQAMEQRASKEWVIQKARIIMVLEHSSSQAELRKYRNSYSTTPKDIRGTFASVNPDSNDNSGYLTILRPTPDARLQKKIGTSSTRQRLSLQHWKVVTKANCRLLTGHKPETLTGHEPETKKKTKCSRYWRHFVENLPGSVL